MGVDATIRIRGEFTDRRLRQMFNELAHRFPSVACHSDYSERYGPWTLEDDGSHELSSLARYYGPAYERGPAMEIVGTLLWLLAQDDVESVCYGGDYDDNPPEISRSGVYELLDHFISVGGIPYAGVSGTCQKCGYFTRVAGYQGGTKRHECLSCDWSDWVKAPAPPAARGEGE